MAAVWSRTGGERRKSETSCSCPRGDTLSHPRGRWWGVLGFQAQPKGLTHSNADGLDAGCEGKELDNFQVFDFGQSGPRPGAEVSSPN